MNSDVSQKVQAFFTTFPLRTFNKRQILIYAEELPSHIFYIIEGKVSQYDITPTGAEVVVNVFKPGAFFPMSSALNNTPNLYFFEASTLVKAHVAPVAEALRFLQENPDVTYDLLKRVYRGVDGVLRRTAHLMGGDATSRILFELLNAARRFGERQADGSISTTLKEVDAARQSGLARETVSRTLQSLKKSGLIRITPQGIFICQPEKLAEQLGTSL